MDTKHLRPPEMTPGLQESNSANVFLGRNGQKLTKCLEIVIDKRSETSAVFQSKVLIVKFNTPIVSFAVRLIV